MAFSLEMSVRRDLYRMAARLLAEEVDAPLYWNLLATQGEVSWIEPELGALPDHVVLETLATEYCRLLVGPDPRCPPFASMVRGEPLLGGRARTSVDAFLASRGLAIDAGARIASPDHVAVVFAVLAELSEPDDIRGWLQDFVLPWVPGWLSALQSHAERALYRTAARLASAMLEEDQIRFGVRGVAGAGDLLSTQSVSTRRS
jgi:TorA maturation chaperone TorD